MAWKYLIVSDPDLNRIEVPIIFHCYLSHQTMGKALNVVAAGFVEIRGLKRNCGDRRDLDVYCYGESESLAVKSRGKADAAIIIGAGHHPQAQF